MTISNELGQRHTIPTALGEVDYFERGAGRTLVFAHGLVVNCDLWAEVVAQLADRYRCVCVDLPLGSHRLPAAPHARLSPTDVAAALVEVMTSVAPDGAVLVANDTGGVLAQIVATTAPERLDALVLTPCDAFDNFLPPLLRYIQAVAWLPGGVWLMTVLLRASWVRRLPIAFGWLVRRDLTAHEWDSFLQPALHDAQIRRDLGRFLRGISVRYTKRTARQLSGFTAPTLFAWADTTRVFPITHAYRLAGTMPDAVVRAVPDSYAFLPLDRPVTLAELIDGFVTERLGTG